MTDDTRTPDREPLTPIVFHVLMALFDRPLHGYAVMQAVEEAAGQALATGPGTVYGTIGRLEEAGLVREVSPSELEDEPAGSGRGRPRKYFGITDEGIEALRVEALRLDRWARLARARKVLPEEAGS